MAAVQTNTLTVTLNSVVDFQPPTLYLSDKGELMAARSVITSKRKQLQEYPKRGPLTVHHHGLNGNASQHQAMAHTLTYGGSSTTNFHHLLQFQGKE